MKNWAHIVNGVVVNISVWDGVTPWSTKDFVVEIPEGSGVTMGWLYVEEEFIDPNPLLPTEADSTSEIV